uniref:Transcriptional adapter n=1 Tax=Biomphalaria glabrata TaxID=6526 RepID=A0A2C9JTC4_BIOGL
MEYDDDALDAFGTKCRACGLPLLTPWIRCAAEHCQPNMNICIQCFSLGIQLEKHSNDHPYCVVKLEFPLYEPSWTATEEIRLLEAICEYGLGNWPTISTRMRTKTPEDCERHYFSCYVDNPKTPLPVFPDPVINKGAPITYKLSDNPPRPAEHTALWHEMGGYSAARGDFNIEHDNFIEMDICQMSFEDEDEENMEGEEEGDRNLFTELKLAALDVYRNSLIERQRKKKIVRDIGLINSRRWYGFVKRRFDLSFSLDAMRPFMRLFPSLTFDKYLESLSYERQLKSDISNLQNYRHNGIVKLRSVKTYQALKQRREFLRTQRHLMSDVLLHVKDEVYFQTWLSKQASRDGAPVALGNTLPPLHRKPVPRLKIENLPGYEKLNDLEKELCSEARLVPQAYLDFSKILIAENAKHGCLKLAQARSLIKIDVNKTRKLYDFLIMQGHIVKSL